MCNSCRSQCYDRDLDVDEICARDVQAQCVVTKELDVTDEICSKMFSADQVCANGLTAKRADLGAVCMSSLNVVDQCVQNFNATNAKASNLVANNICVPGTLSAANISWNNKYKATAVYSQPITNYVLGSDLNFDLEIDDPNNNLVSGPTRYTAPVSGYYMVMMQIDQTNLVPIPPFGPLLGVPVANLILLVNGVDSRQLYSSYLTFLNKQRSTLTAIMRLVAGDVVTARLKVLAVDQASGFTEVTGSIDIEGNAINQNESIFSIHILSTDGNGTSVPCESVISCVACTPLVCEPCIPNQLPEPCGPCEPRTGSSAPHLPSSEAVRARVNRR